MSLLLALTGGSPPTSVEVSISSSVSAPTTSLAVSLVVELSVASSIAAPSTSLSVSLAASASLSSTVQAPTSSVALSLGVAASISSTVDAPTTSLVGALTATAALASTVQAPATSLSVTAGVVVPHYARPGELARADVVNELARAAVPGAARALVPTQSATAQVASHAVGVTTS